MESITIAPEVIFSIGSIDVTETMLSGFCVTVLVLLFVLVVRIFFIPRWAKEPIKKGGLRLLLEYLVGIFDKNAKEQTHKFAGFTASLYLGLSAYICFATLFELFGLRPATSDLNLTIGLGVITFLLIFTLGFVKNKHRRLLHYANPINIITDAVLPVSMAVRLFASVFSGYLVVHLIYEFLPIGVPVIANCIFTIFHAVLQAYIFMFLSLSFIGEAIE